MADAPSNLISYRAKPFWGAAPSATWAELPHELRRLRLLCCQDLTDRGAQFFKMLATGTRTDPCENRKAIFLIASTSEMSERSSMDVRLKYLCI